MDCKHFIWEKKISRNYFLSKTNPKLFRDLPSAPGKPQSRHPIIIDEVKILIWCFSRLTCSISRALGVSSSLIRRPSNRNLAQRKQLFSSLHWYCSLKHTHSTAPPARFVTWERWWGRRPSQHRTSSVFPFELFASPWSESHCCPGQQPSAWCTRCLLPCWCWWQVRKLAVGVLQIWRLVPKWSSLSGWIQLDGR